MLREFDEPVCHDPPPPRPAWLRVLIHAGLAAWIIVLGVSIWLSAL